MKLEKQESWFEDKRRQNLDETAEKIRPVIRDFVKMIAWERQSPESLKQIGEDASNMAEIESLPAHRRSVEKRMGETR